MHLQRVLHRRVQSRWNASRTSVECGSIFSGAPWCTHSVPLMAPDSSSIPISPRPLGSLVPPTAIPNQKHRVGRPSAAIKRYRLHTHTERPFHDCQSCSFYKSLDASINTIFHFSSVTYFNKIDRNLYI